MRDIFMHDSVQGAGSDIPLIGIQSVDSQCHVGGRLRRDNIIRGNDPTLLAEIQIARSENTDRRQERCNHPRGQLHVDDWSSQRSGS